MVKYDLSDAVDKKEEHLKENVRSYESVVVAFSGGVDSTYLLSVAREVLGDKVLAVTATSDTYPLRERNEAIKLAKGMHAKHMLIDSHETEIDGFASNPPSRCYFCKKELFTLLSAVAKKRGLKQVLEGSNADDVHDFRPGMKAIDELSIASPLKDAALTKDEIRALSKRRGLTTWKKPAFACLSSRFPYGTSITPEKLKMVGAAEDILHDMGFLQLRVRHHDTIARIEVDSDSFEHIMKERQTIVDSFKKIGYKYVALDLLGYRMGSMNEVLKKEEKDAS